MSRYTYTIECVTGIKLVKVKIRYKGSSYEFSCDSFDLAQERLREFYLSDTADAQGGGKP